MTKDRLSELLKDQDRNNKNVTIEVENEAHVKTDNKELRKTFERAEIFIQWIEGMEKNVRDVQNHIHRLDLSMNQRDLHDKIQSIFQNNTSISHRINSKLKEFEEDLKTTNKETAEGRIKTIQFNTLRTRYTEIFRQNNAALENYRNIQKNHLEGQLRAKGIRTTDEELELLLENKTNIQVFTDNIIAETQEAKRILADIEERHQQLLQIENMLVEVRDLFLQMAIIIDEQRDLIDRVEYQAQSAKDYIGNTPKILRNAAKKKTKYLKCKIYMGIAVLVFIIIILILLFK
ncbi:unnamed protein product [Phaedon cochleariae]|uniref:t-SNARE coiled-coil homology domain-containing protein n=1 Tax=Phaedon cochleariae TaxID=80249 RepID=A0A9P0GL71_PHACE|nr:unnamed protein product [Phaedon cochleariae]